MWQSFNEDIVPNLKDRLEIFSFKIRTICEITFVKKKQCIKCPNISRENRFI